MKDKVNVCIGGEFTSKYDGKYAVLDILNGKYALIEFADTGQVQYSYIDDVGRVRIRDWSKPQLYGFAYSSGDREHPDSHTLPSESGIYGVWSSMIQRLCDGRQKGYSKTAVSDEWRDYRNFKQWHKENYFKDCALDKDLFSPPGYKKYSAETCCFLPEKINEFLRHYLEHLTGEVIPNYPMERILIPLAELLIEYQGTFSPRAESRLWELCAKHGLKFDAAVDRIKLDSHKKELRELRIIKATRKMERDNNAYANKVGSGFPLVGFLEYKGVHRIRNFSDLSELYRRVRADILAGRVNNPPEGNSR